jgi:hypothetical protein
MSVGNTGDIPDISRGSSVVLIGCISDGFDFVIVEYEFDLRTQRESVLPGKYRS